MAASQNNLSIVINQQDSSGVNIINRPIGAIGYAGADGQFNVSTLLTTGATVIPFPLGVTNALQLYFKNTHATAYITINLTPLSATGSVIVSKLSPGAVSIPLWATASGSSGGYSACTGTSDTANATFEYFIGG